VAVTGISDVGTVDRVGFGASLAIGLVWRRLQVEAVGTGEPNHDIPLARPGAGAAFRKAGAGARLCFTIVPSDVELAACGDGEMNFLQGHTFGIQTTTEGVGHWLELGGSGRVRWAFAGPLGVHLEGRVGAPLQRPDFVITPFGVVHTIPAITGRVGFGIDVHF
jgi:hypothetical protein